VNEIWLALVVVGAATVLLKATGPVLLGGRELPPRVNALVTLLAPAVLAALVVTQVVGGERELVFDARLVGLGAACAAIALRAPLVVVVVVAAGSTAIARAIT
jgi:branched-subunit amino acid transport protein